ncbi:MAG TPA: ABC transporter substrate-binding protein [Longimicrobiales bacterium]
MIEQRRALPEACEPFRSAVHTILLSCLAACAPVTPATDPLPVTVCTVTDDVPRTRVTLGVAGQLDATGARAASRHIAAQIYDTLVRLDCTGTLVPALATSWSSDDGRTWSFQLERGAAFHDGSPVTAAAVARAWMDAAVPGLAEVAAAGQHELRVTLHERSDAHIFAHPSLSIARPVGGAWPAGTGSFVPAGTGSELVLLKRTADARAPDTIELRRIRGDARAAIDAGVDVLVSGSADVVAYARARADYSLAALPWTRTYILLTPSVDAEPVPPPAAALAALAHDAVRADARPAQAPFWWESCATAQRGPTVQGRASEIVYLRDDESGRELAERIAALVWPQGSAPAWLRDRLPDGYTLPRVTPMDEAGLQVALQQGSALAAIVSSPRMRGMDCDDAGVVADGWSVLPLIDTRDYLIHRAGSGRIGVDGYGTIRFGAR